LNFELENRSAILTLSQLTAGIARVFEESFPHQLWIKAEIAKLNHYPGSGHCYPSLVEKEKGVIKAEIRGTIWANDFSRINQRFLQVTREPLKEGIQILFRAQVKYHPVYGLSLQISDIDPSYTLGEMAREKMETIMKLKTEGIFDRNRQLELPLLPKRIAIISVKTSKGFSDFINILENNAWGYAFTCVLFPALLQGDKAVESIRGQLQAVSRVAEHFDVVAIIRGGGGDVGLNCYDNYQLAKEVALCPLPVITGIGHSTNETVVELIAGINKITPTDVAYFLIQQFHNFAARLEEGRSKLINLSKDIMEDERRRWGELSQKLMKQTENTLRIETSGLENISAKLAAASRLVIAENKQVLAFSGARLSYKPLALIKEKQAVLKNTSGMFSMHVNHLLKWHEQHLGNMAQKVKLIDPANVLKRGYSISYFNEKPITDSSEIKPGDTIMTRLYKGNIYSEIKSKEDSDGK
jgi:exodeoxyribonuclease VII large subunit